MTSKNGVKKLGLPDGRQGWLPLSNRLAAWLRQEIDEVAWHSQEAREAHAANLLPIGRQVRGV